MLRVLVSALLLLVGWSTGRMFEGAMAAPSFCTSGYKMVRALEEDHGEERLFRWFLEDTFLELWYSEEAETMSVVAFTSTGACVIQSREGVVRMGDDDGDHLHIP